MKVINKSKRYMVVIFSGIMLFLLLMPVSAEGIAACVAFCLVLILTTSGWQGRSINKGVVIQVVISALLVLAFYVRWIPSNKIHLIARRFHMPASVFIILCGLVLMGAAMPIIRGALVGSSLDLGGELKEKTEYKDGILPIVVCAVAAAGLITCCSRSSPVYPMNTWVDANTYMTMGKSMVRGLVPYRDVCDHKGIVLYLLYGLGYLISQKSFVGVYFVEICALFVFFLFAYKTMRLFAGKAIVLSIPFLALLCGVGRSFGGGGTEEFCLPFLMASLFLFMRAEKEKRSLLIWEALFIGGLSGAVFWIKFNVVGMYAGWFVVYSFIRLRNRRFGEWIKTTGAIAAGVLLLSTPIMIYLISNHAVRDCIDIYFLSNLKVYSEFSEVHSAGGVLLRIWNGISGLVGYYSTQGMVILFGILFLSISRTTLSVYLLFELAGAFLFESVGNRIYAHYFSPMNIFLPVGVVAIYWLVRQKVKADALKKTGSQCLIACITMAMCCLIMLYTSPFKALQWVKKESLPQYRISSIIEKTPDAEILEYRCSDAGIYTLTGIVPKCRMFCGLEWVYPDALDIQNQYLMGETCDYVVVREERGEELDVIEMTLSSIIGGYKCVEEIQDYEIEGVIWRLYTKVP